MHRLKRVVASVVLLAALCGAAEAEPVNVKLDVMINGKPVPMRVWVSESDGNMPPSVPREVDPAQIKLDQTENTIIIKGIYNGTLEDAIRILQTLAGVRNG